MKYFGLAMLVVTLVLCGPATPVRADSGDRADRADQLFKRGKKLLSEKKYAEACAAFEDSDRLDPGIGTKLNVARCYQEWGRLATAWRWYSDAEQMAIAGKDDRARKIRALIDELDPGVPRLKVIAPPGVAARRIVVTLDRIELAASELGVLRRVDPGPHQVDAVIDGAKQTRVVPLERGGSAEVVLDGPAAVAPVRSPAGGVAPADPGRMRRWIGLGTAGAGGLAVVIAGVVTLRERSDYRHALTEHCMDRTDMCDTVGLDRTHTARHRANIATVVSLAGLAAVAGGLYLYVTTPPSEHAAAVARAAAAPAASARRALFVAPVAGSDGAGLVLGGAF